MRQPTRFSRHFVIWTVTGLGLLQVPAAGAQTPAGSQFQINSYTTDFQGEARVATAADGDYVVVWGSVGSSGTDTDEGSIQAQRYASNGATQGAEFQVNAFTTGGQGTPSVAAAADGDFVVAWASEGSSGTDTSLLSIQGQRYASDGTPQGTQFQVNTYTTSLQWNAFVSADSDGDFVVVWESNGPNLTLSIQGQRYASDGSALGVEFQVNSDTTYSARIPSAAVDADRDFVVVWQAGGSSETDTSNSSVQGRRFASDGTPQGAQFQVNSYTTNLQDRASVAADAGGDFVVAWTSYGSYGTDTDIWSVQGQRYASDGSIQGAQFQVNGYTTSLQFSPFAAADTDGDFVVVWSSRGSFGTDASYESVQGQRYASDGTPQGTQFQVNTYATSRQYRPAAAADATGDFVVVWDSYGASGSDSSEYSVQGQRYSVPAPAPPVPAMSSATRLALTAALLLLGAALALRRRS